MLKDEKEVGRLIALVLSAESSLAATRRAQLQSQSHTQSHTQAQAQCNPHSASPQDNGGDRIFWHAEPELELAQKPEPMQLQACKEDSDSKAVIIDDVVFFSEIDVTSEPMTVAESETFPSSVALEHASEASPSMSHSVQARPPVEQSSVEPNSATTAAAAVGGVGGGGSNGAGEPLSLTSEHEALEQQLAVSSDSLREARERLSRSKDEEDNCSKRAHLEELRAVETTEWMIAMQGVLWPENTADSELGRPVLPEQPALRARRGGGGAEGLQNGAALASGDEEVKREQGAGGDRCESDRGPAHYPFYAPVPSSSSSSRMSRSKDLLTYGMCNALDAARMLRIQEVVDVDTTMEAFRWMSWCFRCLHVLRIPPATHTLKRLLVCCKPFKLADEKVVKAVSGILSRSMTWKSKVRKLLLPAVRTSSVSVSLSVPVSVSASIESSRLHALVAEGGMVPMTSSLKDHLVSMWDGLLANATAPPAPIIPAQALDATLPVKPKRGSKATAVPAVPGISKHVTVSMPADAAESSEEEENEEEDEEEARREREGSSDALDPRLQDESSHLSSASAQPDSSSSSISKKRRCRDGEGRRDFVYTTLSPSMWAPLPDLWPPSITARQVVRLAVPSSSISGHSSIHSGESGGGKSINPNPNPVSTPFSSVLISSSNSS